MSNKTKRKRRPAYTPKPSAPKHVPPGMQYALTLANEQLHLEREIRKRMAADNVTSQVQKEYTLDVEDWFFALMALALHDEGWGAKRILRVAERIRDWHREMNDPNFGPLDLWAMVRDEVGLEFDPGDGYKKPSQEDAP